MGHKRNYQEENGLENGVEDSVVVKKSKKSHHKKDESLNNNDTLDMTVEVEETVAEAVSSNGLPRTRRDLIELGYDEKLNYVSIIAQPMANKKLGKKLFKLMRKASKVSRKDCLRIGLKEVQLRIRKGERGLVIFAGDVTPIEIMCHLPAVCEEKDLPYVYVPFRMDISAAIGVRRPALMVLIKRHDDYAEAFDECESKIKEVNSSFLQSL